jgi:hypothetical protein
VATGFCRECGVQVSPNDKVCPGCGAADPTSSAADRTLNGARTEELQRKALIPGVIGCALALLGIFTLGVVFIPLAAVFSLIGILLGLGDRRGLGFVVSAVAVALTIAGAIVSPGVWLLIARLLGSQ